MALALAASRITAAGSETVSAVIATGVQAAPAEIASDPLCTLTQTVTATDTLDPGCTVRDNPIRLAEICSAAFISAGADMRSTGLGTMDNGITPTADNEPPEPDRPSSDTKMVIF